MTVSIAKIEVSKSVNKAIVTLAGTAETNVQSLSITDPSGYAQLIEETENGGLAQYLGQFDHDGDEDIAADRAQATDWEVLYQAA